MSAFAAMGLLIAVLAVFFPHEEDVILIDAAGKDCIIVTKGVCYTHKDIQRPDGLIDLDKARAIGLIK